MLAAAAVTAAAAASAGARAEVLWCGLTGTAAVAVVAAEAGRRGRALAILREQHTKLEAELSRRLARQDVATTTLAKETLPAAVRRLQRTGSVDNAMRAHETRDPLLSPEFQAARDEVLYRVLQIVDNEEALREATQRAFVNIARRVQAIIHRQAQDLREMEDRHGNDPAVFDDLLRLDHGNALTGRLADSIAVLGGARPGRQWSRPVALYSVLRGGMSRILEYQRVDLHPVAEVAVVGPAVEPLIHAVAELLDNATRYSPPHTHVHLSASEVQSGIAIDIEDGGLGLSDDSRIRAERILKTAQGDFGLNDLGETPRLGLAVVGRLCRAYGFQVSLRPSAYGGVRAVLIVPQELLTTAPATGRAHGIGSFSGPRPLPANPPRQKAGSRPWGATAAPVAASGPSSGTSPWAASGPMRPGPTRANGVRPGPAEDDVTVVTERTANGLPQRRRHRPGPTGTGVPGPARAPEPTGDTTGTADRKPVEPGVWLAAFMEGVNGEAPSTGSAGQTSEETSGKGEQ
nr:ATP-binding protein [Streptomyces kaniharaensis]